MTDPRNPSPLPRLRPCDLGVDDHYQRLAEYGADEEWSGYNETEARDIQGLQLQEETTWNGRGAERRRQ